MNRDNVILDPGDLEGTLRRLALAYDLTPDVLEMVAQVLAIYPCSARVRYDEAAALLYQGISLTDKFTFNIETDDLIVFDDSPETLIDALIEMAMYLTGFSTMLGNEEEWVVEFTAGAWKLVRNQIKRRLDLPVSDEPRAIVGQPPKATGPSAGDPYPFRRLVSQYHLGSFYQMVVLAARHDVQVYFPPETHPKVLAVYVYMRRTMQEVAQSLDIPDYQEFNQRLIQAVQRLHHLFDPANLPPPGAEGTQHLHQLPAPRDESGPKGLLLPRVQSPTHDAPQSEKHDPFAAFIEELFADEDED
ncbi:MAG: hypothetical protein GXY36_06440 [Chloroflexi bacterium]|nr:hypothetical protein [Chloroflexota bacterium]